MMKPWATTSPCPIGPTGEPIGSLTDVPRLDGRAALSMATEGFAVATATEARPRTAVVVLNWNGWRDTIPCVESLRAMEDVPSVFVVDNGSSDDSVAHIRSAAPWAELVLLASNRGFSAGMNAGIAAALEQDPAAEYVWVLNNDTLVQRETLSRMIRIADRDPTIGIVGSLLIDADGSGRVQALGGGRIGRWLGTTSTFVRPTTRSCDYLTGASLLLRRALLLEIGWFDERYFFYYEDADLSVRVRRAGWRLAVATEAAVLHHRGASINRGATGRSLAGDVEHAKSTAIFLSHLPLPARLIAIPVRFAAMLVKRAARRQPERLLPIARAYADGLRIGRRPPMIPMFRCRNPHSGDHDLGSTGPAG